MYREAIDPELHEFVKALRERQFIPQKTRRKLKRKNEFNIIDSESIFIDEIYSKPPKKNYATNKTDVYHIDDFWSLDILDLKDNGPENIRRYRYILGEVDDFSKFGWKTPLKNKNAQTIKYSSDNIFISSKENQI